jgi:hypothetical protein
MDSSDGKKESEQYALDLMEVMARYDHLPRESHAWVLSNLELVS